MSDITDSVDTVSSVANAVPVVGGILSAVTNVIGSIIPKKEGISQQAIQINNSMQPLIAQYCTEQNVLMPGSVNVSLTVTNFSKVQGISAIKLWVQQWQVDGTYAKVAPHMPLSWFQNVNKALQSIPGLPIPANVTQTTSLTSLTNAVQPITNTLNKALGTNMSSTNIFLIIGMVGALAYFFFKGKK